MGLRKLLEIIIIFHRLGDQCIYYIVPNVFYYDVGFIAKYSANNIVVKSIAKGIEYQTEYV